MDEVENVFAELDALLSEFRTFLETDTTVQDIKSAVDALAQVLPPIADILNRLKTIFEVLRIEINNINLDDIPDVDVNQIVEFASKVKDTLQTAKSLIPSQQENIDTVIDSADLIASVPELTDALKINILDSLDAIIDLLTTS
ncbi:MAG: hypothetical protein H6657_00200 [Ardenticatenaceae bacterium]|nr:hypothetical protein [Ardenticatenaceae bacterium]